MQKQVTLAREVAYAGVGLHSGREVHLAIKPAPAETGIVFRRMDKAGALIPARAENVTSTLRATTISAGGLEVCTIEHLMSAFHALAIDNAFVELDAEEPPVADGASLTFFRLLRRAGRKEQDAARKERVIDRIYRIDDEAAGRFVMALPYNGFRVSFTSINPHKLIGIEYEDFHVREDVYEKEIAPARTIAYEGEIKKLHEMGLGLGGTLESVIVYNDEGWVNPLHFDDELVRHKILDVIGDIRLAGIVRGHIIAVASGHALNTALAKKIEAARSGAYQIES